MSKRNKIVIIILIITIAVTAALSVRIFQQRADKQQSDAEETIVLENGQSFVFAKITAAIGNEISYVIVEEQENGGYQETQEEGQLQIPVGTEVVTKLGTSTTFSRLANGDVIRLLMQQTQDGEEVIKIWIVD
ncbi:MAG: hypothetical protein J6D08_02350 [Lachnospiraceae bacterium]|nr:hypothetical protein [Lachnospiraceae bacterium]